MKDFYEMQIAGLTRRLPICKLTQDLCIAGFVIFGDPELTVAAAGELVKQMPEHDYMITAEAKGIPLIHEMARQAGEKKYILARKAEKVYMRDVFHVTVNSITTRFQQTLYLDGADEATVRSVGEKAMIVGYTRIMQRMLRLRASGDQSAQPIIDNCLQHLEELLPRTDTLVF